MTRTSHYLRLLVSQQALQQAIDDTFEEAQKAAGGWRLGGEWHIRMSAAMNAVDVTNYNPNIPVEQGRLPLRAVNFRHHKEKGAEEVDEEGRVEAGSWGMTRKLVWLRLVVSEAKQTSTEPVYV
jgi:hypothetical protein